MKKVNSAMNTHSREGLEGWKALPEEVMNELR